MLWLCACAGNEAGDVRNMDGGADLDGAIDDTNDSFETDTDDSGGPDGGPTDAGAIPTPEPTVNRPRGAYPLGSIITSSGHKPSERNTSLRENRWL